MSIFNETPSLIKIKSEIGNEALVIFVMKIIGDVVEYFSVGKSMGVEQTKQTAELLISEHYYLKPSELKYCFNKGKIGAYGRIYDRIDGGVFFDWINRYLIEREETCIAHNEKSASDYNSKEYKENSAKIILPVLKKSVESIENPKLKPIKKAETVTDKFQKLLKEFDQLRKDQEYADNGRFVTYSGEKMNYDEFVEFRINEINETNNK